MPISPERQVADFAFQVRRLAEQLLVVTANLETVVTNVKALSSSLSKVAKRLTEYDASRASSLSTSVVMLTDQSLIHEPFITLNLSSSNLSEVSSKASQLSKFSYHNNESVASGAGQSDRGFDVSWSSGIEHGLDEAHELDWDSDGIQLSGSSGCDDYSCKCKQSIPFPYTFDSRCEHLDRKGIYSNTKKYDKPAVDKLSGVRRRSIVTPDVYDGSYEEVMEMSLEFEEGFYSDDDGEGEEGNGEESSDGSAQEYYTPKSEHSLEEPLIHINNGAIMKRCNYHLVSINDDFSSSRSELSANSSPHMTRSCHKKQSMNTCSKNLEKYLDADKSQTLTYDRKYFWIEPRRSNSFSLRRPVVV